MGWTKAGLPASGGEPLAALDPPPKPPAVTSYEMINNAAADALPAHAAATTKHVEKRNILRFVDAST